MHNPPLLADDVPVMIESLLACPGWPLVAQLFADSETIQVSSIRRDPLAPTATAAAVKLAHIEELRTLFCSRVPKKYGDPFDVAQRPSKSGDGSGDRPPVPDAEPDEYQL